MAASQFSAAPPPPPPPPPTSAVSASEADSCRIYGSSYSGVSFGSGFSPDNLLLTDRRPVRSRSAPADKLCLSLCLRHPTVSSKACSRAVRSPRSFVRSSLFWYQFLHFRLTYSFTHHFWFTTLFIHNSLSLSLPA